MPDTDKKTIKSKRPPKWPKHRPTKCTPEITKEVCDYIMAGNYIEISCLLAGISKRSFYNWIKRGKKAEENNNTNSPYYHFMHEVTYAMAFNEGWLVEQVMKEAKDGDVRASMWMLERKYNDRWGRGNLDIVVKEEQEIEGKSKQVEDYAANVEKAALRRLGYEGTDKDTEQDSSRVQDTDSG